MLRVLSSMVAVVAIGSGLVITYFMNYVPKKPDMDLQQWWGIGLKPREEDTSIRHFKIDFNDAMIHDLKQRLRNKRPLTKPLEGLQSELGLNTRYLEYVVDYWINKYNFKGRAEYLNRFSHYKTRIQGLDIHYIWEKPKKTRDVTVLPILMLHGWPSSSKEFDKVIPMLTSRKAGKDFVFEVIAPDLPGFGFSQATNKQGLSPAHIAVVMRNLMRRLGFDKFYIQAGDWGSQIATHMSTIFPDEVLGFHSNMPLSGHPTSYLKMLVGALCPPLFIEREHMSRLYPLKRTLSKLWHESGYFHIQATKPDTIGVALSDSPAGLASYIIEKMGVASNGDQINTPHSGIANLNLDDVLDTITIMWANNCIVTSSRIYVEAFRVPEIVILHRIPTYVPMAAIKFQHEIIYQTDWMLRDKFKNLLHSTTLDFGGHFAALQNPQVLADDLFTSTVEFLKFHARQ